MSTISINSNINLDVQTILNGISNLDNKSLEEFAEAVNTILAKRKVASLSKKETDLLKKINLTPDEKIVSEFRVLQKKNVAGKISQKEFERINELVKRLNIKTPQPLVIE